MTKTLIIAIMKELIIITTITVIKLTCGGNSIEKKTYKLDLIKNFVMKTRIETSFSINVTNTKGKC